MAAPLWLSRTTTVLSATLLTGIGAAATAAPASAATTGKASVSNTHISFVAGSGQANRVVITRSGRTVTIDDKYAIKAGKGCRAVKGDKTKVRCTPANGKRPLTVGIEVGNRSDKVTNKTGLSTVVQAGTGHDVITGGAGKDSVFGDGGNDTFHGRGGNDWFIGYQGNDKAYGGSGNDSLFGGLGRDVLDGGSGDDGLGGEFEERNISYGAPGADVIRGGSGQDLVYYNERDRAVRVDLDGRPGDDGVPGEGDTVGADVEDVQGSAHGDVLIGNSAANRLYGSEGDDEMRGGDGNDTLDGDFGSDKIYGEGGDDSLFAKEGPHELDQRADDVNGGSDVSVRGDLCVVAPVDVVTDCERIQS